LEFVVLAVNLAGHESRLCTLRSCFRTRAFMQLEILALRHQLAVLQRRTPKRPSLKSADRLLWVMLSRVW
jgi:hypothetical protein